MSYLQFTLWKSLPECWIIDVDLIKKYTGISTTDISSEDSLMKINSYFEK